MGGGGGKNSFEARDLISSVFQEVILTCCGKLQRQICFWWEKWSFRHRLFQTSPESAAGEAYAFDRPGDLAH